MKSLNEATQVRPILEHADKMPVGVLARVTYPICNIDTLNHNNRIYEKSVFDKVLSDTNICEKLNTRTLFGDSEHPEEGTKTRLEENRISHLVSKMWIDESKKQVFATLDILDTTPGRFLNTLLLAECQVGVSTRAEGELEEAIDESTGNKYYRVLPEAYQFKTVDFTADPSTLGALPENITYNSVRKIKEGINEGKIDVNSAKSVLKNFKSKEAVLLYESLNLGSDNMTNKSKKVEEATITPNKSKGKEIWGDSVVPEGQNIIGVLKRNNNEEYAYLESVHGEYSLGKDGKIVQSIKNEGKIPNPKDQDSKVVDTLIEKTVKEDDEHKEHEDLESPEQEAAEHGGALDPDPIVPPVEEIPSPLEAPVLPPKTLRDEVLDVANKAQEVIANAAEVVSKAETFIAITEPTNSVLPIEEPIVPPVEEIPAPVVDNDEEEYLEENRKLKGKLKALRAEYIKESSISSDLKKVNEEYNGWENYETWNVMLWLGNDEDMYNKMREFVKNNSGKITPDMSRKFVESIMPDGTPDFEDMGGSEAYNKVNWADIAKAFGEELDESKSVLFVRMYEKIRVNERAMASSLKKIMTLEKVNESLKKDNEQLKKINEGHTAEKRAIEESINREVVKRYTKHLIESSGYSVPNNTLAILEGCGTEDEVDKMFTQVRTNLNEMSLHSNVIAEIQVPSLSKVKNDPEQERLERAVRIIKEGF